MISINDRVKIFIAIRDIPYRLSDKFHDSICLSKAKILGEILWRCGFECRIAQCKFKWIDLNIPKFLIDIRKKLKKDLVSNHTFLRVFIPETKKWVTVDTTWDKNLKVVFPIATWDGLGNTILAVKTKNFLELKNETNEFLTPFDIDFPNFDKRNEFVIKFNQWLKKIRKKEQ